MNIKSLKKVAKVVAAVAMVGVVSGCVSVPVGTKIKAEVERVEPWEKAHEVKDRLWNIKYLDEVYAGRTPPGGTRIAQLHYMNGVFGGGGHSHLLAVVPPGTDPMPKAGDFVEFSSGDSDWTIPNTFVRILSGNCGWRGFGLVSSREIVCDSEK